jgi:hypothetical protein
MLPFARPMHRLAALLVALVALPRSAAAVGESEAQVALSGGAGWLGRSGVAATLRLEGQYGLTESLALHGAAGAWLGATQAGVLDLGLTYSLDVLRVVPFVEAGVALLVGAEVAVGPLVGVGGEYLVDRHWAVALWGRAGYLHGDGRWAGLVMAGARVGYVF